MLINEHGELTPLGSGDRGNMPKQQTQTDVRGNGMENKIHIFSRRRAASCIAHTSPRLILNVLLLMSNCCISCGLSVSGSVCLGWRIAVPLGELVIPVLNQECSSGRVLIMVPYFPRLFRHTGLTVGTLSVSKAKPDAIEAERCSCADD